MSNRNNVFQVNQKRIDYASMYSDSTHYSDNNDNICFSPANYTVNLDTISVGEKSSKNREKMGTSSCLFIDFKP